MAPQEENLQDQDDSFHGWRIVTSRMTDVKTPSFGPNLGYAQRRPNITSGGAQDTAAKLHLPNQANFTVFQDLPGTLSIYGPRHDNDFEDISKIRILPTMSELMSTRQDYRPPHDPTRLHLPGIRGLIDRHFRLLREDTVGQLKKGINEELRNLQNPNGEPISYLQNNVRKYLSYNIVDIVDTTCKRRPGLEFHLKLKQPELASRLSTEAREDWWRISKRLEIGALVCFLQRDTAVFCAVSESTIRPKIDPVRNPTKGNRDRQFEKRDLHSNADFAYVSLSLAEPSDVDLKVMLRAIRHERPTQRSLVEFPGVLVPSFKPILSALQHVSKTLDLPFTDLLAPISDGLTQITIPPPLYTTKPKFAFNLKCITSDGGNFTFRPKNNPNPRDLASRSSLDEGQSLALLNTLKRSLALIQGPPGTGKSYTGEAIIKVLLANKDKADIGPIVCVCRTNHALDQLLENLWHGGVKQIIRIGSGSQSLIIKQVNLHKVAQDVERTNLEKRALWKSGSALGDAEKSLKTFITQMQTLISQREKEYVKSTAMLCYEAVFGPEQDQWTAGTEQDGDAQFRRWVNEGIVSESAPREIDLLINQDPTMFSRQERSLLRETWAFAVISDLEDEFLSLHHDYWRARKRHETSIGEVDLRILRNANIIGATTTGLAKNLETLRKLDTKVLLCEEAGEVLESHILTALLPSIEHAILIGDHLQLRPHIDNYELSIANPHGEQYSLDVSLFERLVKPARLTDLRLPFDMLEIQRRMHPSISKLIRNTLYRNLKDSKEVGHYPEVAGMRKRLYWFDHAYPETMPKPNQVTDTSRMNKFEVEMICAFVSYLVRQGVYGHDDIAVITPYLGQLHKLRHRLQESFEVMVEDRDLVDLQDEGFDVNNIHRQELGSCLRLATIDNFQGEEAKVVVISLVRSNLDQQCGFMKTSNRINVLLSRAKHGMYIFGNSTTYSGVHMWSEVIGMFKENDNIGTSLPLQCPRHKDTLIEVSGPEDFARLSSEAGCNAQCLQVLECGHACPSKCHAASLHMAIKCQERCSLLKKACGHGCPNRCGEPCEENCSTILEGKKLPLPCGHVLTSPRCWQTLVPGEIQCRQRTQITISGCNHRVLLPCRGDVAVNDIICPVRCDHLLSCGHQCSGTCKTCLVRKDGKIVKEEHQNCTSICGRSYGTCSHICKRPCHPDACPPCDIGCDVQCKHVKCRRTCSERCVPCKKDKCSSRCPHGRCTMPCAAPCNWIPCSRRCKKALQPCGHQCPSLCGEACPDAKYCQTCASEGIKKTVVDMKEVREYRDINLDADPCIFPNCGHIMTVSSMDSQLGMSDYYESLDDGTVIAIKSPYMPLSSTAIKACPKCRGGLRNIRRYGRLVRQSLLDESTRRFICWSHAQFIMLERRLLDEQQRLEHTEDSGKPLKLFNKVDKREMGVFPIDHMLAIHKWIDNGRYKRIIALYFDIFLYMDRVRDEERPYKRVFDLIEEANRVEGPTCQFQPSPSRVHTRGELLARVMLFRCYLMVLSDFLKLRNDAPQRFTTMHFGLGKPIEDCELLIKLAQMTGYIIQEAEGHIFFARLVGLVRQLVDSEAECDLKAIGLCDTIIAKAKDHYSQAQAIVRDYQPAAHLQKELDAVGKMLNRGGFYLGMSAQEQRVIHQEMAKKFTGIGYWCTCAHGHPFPVADGNLLTENAKCPECDALVGKIDS